MTDTKTTSTISAAAQANLDEAYNLYWKAYTSKTASDEQVERLRQAYCQLRDQLAAR